ncbi:Vid24 family protein [Schizosaccharomyces pombe]|uniref:GID complex substrate-recognition subunit 10 n=1 Tax=Schizosaccharomyces pombe (strain 972 / ATCC 24843) TaxID=284812 RepID=GID10_SCHPO|nr:putative Vid24 family protein [Schizosaccharomyces pombe]Q9UT04.1 RecName: Full=Uncharacterized protein P8A3.13c [Schizosaccharomyces pombe 972h-]CAB55180.1 Vid24 family protein (predicted) [Schizosaccharomyces pombe]|eukprot:NP_594952.1 putative Vid24 family protein [Schizosaccharomyces pombe]
MPRSLDNFQNEDSSHPNEQGAWADSGSGFPNPNSNDVSNSQRNHHRHMFPLARIRSELSEQDSSISFTHDPLHIPLPNPSNNNDNIFHPQVHSSFHSRSASRQRRRSGLSRSNATRYSRRSLSDWLETIRENNYDEASIPSFFSPHTERLVGRVLRLNRYLQNSELLDRNSSTFGSNPNSVFSAQPTEPSVEPPTSSFPIQPPLPPSRSISISNPQSLSFPSSFDQSNYNFQAASTPQFNPLIEHLRRSNSPLNPSHDSAGASTFNTYFPNSTYQNILNSLDNNPAVLDLNGPPNQESSSSASSYGSRTQTPNARSCSLNIVFHKHKKVCTYYMIRHYAKRRLFITPTWWLRSGSVFRGLQFGGVQSISGLPPLTNPKERWIVDVSIHVVDYKRRALEGQLNAQARSSDPSSTISTAWTGEILDFSEKLNFATEKWSAPLEIDVCYWRKLAPFQNMDTNTFLETITNPKKLYKICQKYIFMRWKDMLILKDQTDTSESRITGFYFCCLCRENGYIQGYYYDPKHAFCSQPLNLFPEQPSLSPSYHFV